MNWHDHYEYRCGKLYRKYKKHNHPAGKECGFIDQVGYVRTKLNSKMTFAHRIVWEMHNGKISDGMEIDHLNGVKSDNRIENLRSVPHAVNMKNKMSYKNNKTGFTGVFYNEESSSYDAYITCNGKRKRLGSYRTIEEARDARLNEIIKIKEFTERHGK